MADEDVEYREFYLRLPNGGPVARGRPADELGTNGSRKFVVHTGQPVRPEVVPSFATRVAAAHRQREELIRQGRIRQSEKWPGWLETAEVLAWIAAHKPPMLHLIITGRDAPRALIEAADLVTEMREVKHPLHTQGIRAQKGIEF